MKQDRRFKKQDYNPQQVKGHLEGATKKLKTAVTISDDDEESSYQLAYEAMLKASLALILKHELRPRSIPGHHIAIIEMAGNLLGDQLTDMLKVFDEMRRNRNNFLYESRSFVSTQELNEALKIAKSFLEIIRNKIENK